jgi:hypothetical protein
MDNLNDDTPLTNFSPACPNPIVFNLQNHLAKLYDRLDPRSPFFTRVEQHDNLRALIKLYETGQRKDNTTEIFIQDGEIVPRDVALTSPKWSYMEVRFPPLFCCCWE